MRTGVTAILPRGKALERSGVRRLVLAQRQRRDDRHDVDRGRPAFSKGPVLITNTHSVGTVRDAAIAWAVAKHGKLLQPWALPVVAET